MSECPDLARTIWEASRADGSTISATGADIVAERILASDWLAAHDAVVVAEERERCARAAESNHRPYGFGLGALNTGSRSQWYSRGRDQAANEIRKGSL